MRSVQSVGFTGGSGSDAQEVRTAAGGWAADRRALSWRVSRSVHVSGGITDSSLSLMSLGLSICKLGILSAGDGKMARNHMEETFQYL